MTVDREFAAVPIEQVQAYWDKRPCNIRHSPKEIGTREYFDEVERRKYFVEPHISRFADFERWRDKEVLEIGCGIGTDTINFARAGARVTAVDVSQESLNVAIRRARIYGLANIHFYRADAEVLADTIPPRPFDLVYSFGVIHHSPHPERIIETVRTNYLRSGSILKVMVYHRYSWKVFRMLLTSGRFRFWKLNDVIARHSEAETGCPVTYTYSPRTVRRLLSGMLIDDVSVEHIFPFRISEYVHYRYVREWYFQFLPPAVFRALEHGLGWHLCVTARAA
jgi:SAM-dependent methyltransferase